MTPDEMLAQITPQIRALAAAEASRATIAASNKAAMQIQAASASAKQQIAAAGASATKAAKNAVIASGLIGGVLGGLVGFYLARRFGR
jgi:multidrug resistance efflux pump